MKTKKIMFILLILISALSYSFSQGSGEDRWSLGPRGGVNFSNVTNVDNSESITGVVLGLSTTFSLNENTGLTLDALYSVEGYQAPFNEYRLRYLEVPLYFDYFFGQLGQRFRPKVYVGMAPAFYLSGTVNELDDNPDYFNHVLVSATGGLGFNYRIANRIWLNTDLRSFIGLSDIRDKSIATGDQVAMRNIQFTLALCYGFGKL